MSAIKFGILVTALFIVACHATTSAPRAEEEDIETEIEELSRQIDDVTVVYNDIWAHRGVELDPKKIILRNIYNYLEVQGQYVATSIHPLEYPEHLLELALNFLKDYMKRVSSEGDPPLVDGEHYKRDSPLGDSDSSESDPSLSDSESADRPAISLGYSDSSESDPSLSDSGSYAEVTASNNEWHDFFTLEPDDESVPEILLSILMSYIPSDDQTSDDNSIKISIQELKESFENSINDTSFRKERTTPVYPEIATYNNLTAEDKTRLLETYNQLSLPEIEELTLEGTSESLAPVDKLFLLRLLGERKIIDTHMQLKTFISAEELLSLRKNEVAFKKKYDEYQSEKKIVDTKYRVVALNYLSTKNLLRNSSDNEA